MVTLNLAVTSMSSVLKCVARVSGKITLHAYSIDETRGHVMITLDASEVNGLLMMASQWVAAWEITNA